MGKEKEKEKEKNLRAPSTMLTEKLFGHKSPSPEVIGWPEDQEKRRKVLIATLEYEIMDWKLKVK